MADLDAVDVRLLLELQRDARLSFRQLGQRVSLSPPAVADRVRRLEERGVITGYRATVDQASLGRPVVCYLELRCSLGRCLLKTSTPDEHPEILEIHKLTGARCTLLKVAVADLARLEALIEQIGQHGELSTSMVLSTPWQNTVLQPLPDSDPSPPVTWGR